MGRPRLSLEQKLWSRVTKGAPDDCWIWTGATNNKGYGLLGKDAGATFTAHRASYTLAHGPISPGMFVLHRCDNPPCVNPAHLFLGTPLDNMQDMMRKGRGTPGERSGMAKLTNDQAREIRRRYAAGGISHAALSREYGVRKPRITHILLGRSYREA